MKRLLLLALLPFFLHVTLSAYTGATGKGAPELEVRIKATPETGNPPDLADAEDEDSEAESDKTIYNVKPQQIERTLAIVKPLAVQNRHIGDITARWENKGLHVVALKMTQLTKDQASKFYDVHRNLPFFQPLWTTCHPVPLL